MKLRTLMSWLLLSITLMVCAHAQNKEVDQYLAQKAPLKTVSYKKLSETTRDLIKKTIDKDPESAKNVISHYVDLLKGTPRYQDSLRTESKITDIRQQGLIREIIYPLRYEKGITGGLIELIHHLNQRPDNYRLSIYRMIKEIAPEEYNVSWDTPKRDEKYKKFARATASEYAKISDPQHAQFFKVAWFVILQEQFGAGQIIPKSSSAAQKLKSGNVKQDEFYDWLFYCHSFNHLFASFSIESTYRRYKPYLNSAVFRIRTTEFNKAKEGLMKEMEKFSHQEKLIIYSSIYNMPLTVYNNNSFYYSSIMWGEIDPQIDEVLVDSYLALVKENPLMRVSYDTRHYLGMHKLFDFLDEGRKRKFALECAKSFVACMDYNKNEGEVYFKFMENILSHAAMTKEGADYVYKAVANRYDEVKGLGTLAQVFLKYGYVDAAYKILPAGEIKHMEVSYERLTHTKSMDENLPKLLKKYKDPVDKLMAAHFMLLPDKEITLMDQTSTYNERLGKILEMASAYDPELEFSRHITDFMKLYIGNFQFSDQDLLEKAYTGKNAFQPISYYKERSYSGDFCTNDGKVLYAMLQQLLINADKDLLREYIQLGHAVYKEKDIKPFNKAFFMDTLVLSITGGIDRMYAEGDHDELVVELLPIYREALEIRAFSEGRIKTSANGSRVMAIKAHRIVEFIHHDLGKHEDYKQWVKKLGKKGDFLREEGQYTFSTNLPPIFGSGVAELMKGYKGRILDNVKLITRIVNNERYQEHLVSENSLGGVIDYVVDSRNMQLKQGIDFIEGGYIKVKEPSMEGLLYSDRAHFAALRGDYDLMEKHFTKMHEVFQEHPTPNPTRMASQYVRAMLYYNAIGQKEKAKSVMPAHLVKSMNSFDKKEYNSLMKKGTKTKAKNEKNTKNGKNGEKSKKGKKGKKGKKK